MGEAASEEVVDVHEDGFGFFAFDCFYFDGFFEPEFILANDDGFDFPVVPEGDCVYFLIEYFDIFFDLRGGLPIAE